MRPSPLDDILDVLSRASVGDLEARVDTDPEDLDDDLPLIANAVNLLLDDLVYRQKERERALEAAAAVRAKEEFLSHLSHDMLTPLAVLLGYLDLLDPEETEPEPTEEVVAPMRHAAQTLQRYVRQFLDYARLESDQPLLVRREPVAVADMLERVLLMFPARHTVKTEFRTAEAVVLADVERTERIIANLLANAFTHAGADASIRIEVNGDPAYIAVAVIDDGRGMTPADLRRAFEKFARGTAAAGTPGTGLGLFMSRILAEAQDGELTATSTPGEGSRFVLTLPRHMP
jgi:signal transduction histidine kinase